MTSERAKAFILPLVLLSVFEIWARTVHLQSDSLAPPSAILLALGILSDQSRAPE